MKRNVSVWNENYFLKAGYIKDRTKKLTKFSETLCYFHLMAFQCFVLYLHFYFYFLFLHFFLLFFSFFSFLFFFPFSCLFLFLFTFFFSGYTGKISNLHSYTLVLYYNSSQTLLESTAMWWVLSCNGCGWNMETGNCVMHEIGISWTHRRTWEELEALHSSPWTSTSNW